MSTLHEMKKIHAERVFARLIYMVGEDEKVAITDNGTGFTFNSVYIGGFEFKPQYEGGANSWNRKPNGKYRIVFSEKSGKNGQERQVNMPQQADTRFDYNRIACALLVEARAKAKNLSEYQRRKDNEAGCEAFRKDHGLARYSGEVTVSASSDSNLPAYMSVRFARNLTYSHAESLLNSLRELGLNIALPIESKE